MVARYLEVGRKGWSYFLSAIETPHSIPATALAVARGAHLGEFLKLSSRRGWLERAQLQTVIDVGAHKGEFSRAIRALLPAIRVYAFEPLEDRHNELRAKLQSAELFQAFCVALGDINGEVSFRRNSFTKASSVLPMAEAHKRAFPWTDVSTTTSVPMRRLDDFESELILEPKVMLKLDVQGYEDRVLAGAQRMLEKVDYILIEVSFVELYEGQPTFKEIFSLLDESGFAYIGSWDQLHSPVDQSILQADAFFARRVERGRPRR
jgi:FkbM family methyltransferase